MHSSANSAQPNFRRIRLAVVPPSVYCASLALPYVVALNIATNLEICKNCGVDSEKDV